MSNLGVINGKENRQRKVLEQNDRSVHNSEVSGGRSSGNVYKVVNNNTGMVV